MAIRSKKFRSKPVAGNAPEPRDATPGTHERVVEGALSGVIDRLTRQAQEQVRLKAVIEERWVENLRRYHGRYDVITEQKLRDTKNQKSRLFVNITRPKTVAWEARLSDLLFPTDDRNWSIEPTPVPEMADAARRATKAAIRAARDATEAVQGGDQQGAQQIAAKGTEAARQGEEIDANMEEAKSRAGLMQAEIDDQLEECSYNIECRQAIHDCTKLGTGIVKGPIAAQTKRRAWQKVQDGAPGSAAVYKLGMADDMGRPIYRRVDPWSFFPDMTASRMAESEFTFERHLWNQKQLRDEGEQLGFDPRATGEILREKPQTALPDYIARLRQIVSGLAPVMEARYQVWEYRGPLDREEIVAVAKAMGVDDAKTEAMLDGNPFKRVDVVLWFCQGKLLKFGPGPLDSAESIYSAVPFEPDDSSIFGLGVPDLIADSQAAICAAWRMQIDNAALSTGPQIVVDTDVIKPAGGANATWDLQSMKVWLRTTTSDNKMPEAYKPFEIFNIPSQQQYLQNIITMAEQFADSETFMPKVAEGEAGTHQQTAQGLSMLMNSANVVFRRIVKNFDDMMTVPNLRRIYDWNMQFSKREEIKGDYEVRARGSSVLILRELQLQNLNAMLTNFAANPVIGPMMKVRNLFVKYLQAAHISEDEGCKSQEVIDREAAERARQAAAMQQAPQRAGKTQAEMDHEVKLHQMDDETKIKVAEITSGTKLQTVAQESNMTLQDLNAKKQALDATHAHKERVVAAEAATGPKQAAAIGGSEF